MMTKCPQCGSTEIVPDLVIFASVNAMHGPLFVMQTDPAKKAPHEEVGFRVDVCGNCGHAELYTRFAKDLLTAHKKGYITAQP